MDALTPDLGEWPTYTYPQVDKLLTLSSGTARRWINGYTRNRRIYPPIVRMHQAATAWVTWNEFLETRLMAGYRDVDQVPIQHIRQVVERLREATGDRHPLTKWSTYIRPERKRLLLDAQLPGDPDGAPFQFVEQGDSGQLMFTPWVQEFVDAVDQSEITDDEIGGIRPDPVFQEIVCVPQRRGGRPTVRGKNVLARTLAELVEAGEEPDEIARWYGVTVAQVDEADRYVNAHPLAA